MKLPWISLCLAALNSMRAMALSDHLSRVEFVNAMDKVTEKRRLVDLRKQLLAKSRPVPENFRVLEDGANDDAVQGDDAVGDDGNQDEEQANDDYQGDDRVVNDDGLNLSSYSLKYVGCQAVNTFSDTMAADEETTTVFQQERFVILRLCPTSWCSRYRTYGCGGRNYGEYMVLMEEYLAIMKDYHYARFATYCATCMQCMGGSQYVTYQASDGGGNRRLGDDDAAGDDAVDDDYVAGDDAYAAGDDAAGDDAANDDAYAAGDDAANDDAYAAGDDAAGDDVAAGDDAGADNNYWNNANDNYWSNAENEDVYDQSYCQHEEQCANYQEVCAYHNYQQTDYESYMECTQFVHDGSVFYLGPHCSGDRHTITIGVYKDQYCSNFLGDVGTFEDFQDDGFNIDDDSLAFYYSPSCISCSDKNSGWMLGSVDYGESDDATYELCDVMYDTSAKCNQNLAIDDNDFDTENQGVTEETVCSFISSLTDNNYDEGGEIILVSDKYEWYNYHHYGVSLVQVALLVISSTLFVGLLAYVVYLNRAMKVRKPWTRPMLDPDSPEAIAGKISRTNSEIISCRSPKSWISISDDSLSSISGHY